MIRTATISKSRLEAFVLELKKVGESLKKSSKPVIISEEKSSVELDGVEMRLMGPENGPYTLIIKGPDEQSEVIKSYAERFSTYSKE